ncbi:unnamed protein product [Amoebophrya sp. A25]|nr:unnamed protein product [Amoebophrya sp. A25]|eukprot:GSA25T00026819001.1
MSEDLLLSTRNFGKAELQLLRSCNDAAQFDNITVDNRADVLQGERSRRRSPCLQGEPSSSSSRTKGNFLATSNSSSSSILVDQDEASDEYSSVLSSSRSSSSSDIVVLDDDDDEESFDEQREVVSSTKQRRKRARGRLKDSSNLLRDPKRRCSEKSIVGHYDNKTKNRTKEKRREDQNVTLVEELKQQSWR